MPAAREPRRPLAASARPLRLHATVVVVGLAVLLAVVADLWSGGPLSRLDDAVQALDLRGRWPGGVAAATVLDHMGARWFVLPPLSLLAVVLARRRRTLRPVLEVVVLALLTTAVVGALKTTTGRARPVTGDGDLFAHDWPVGLIFPSGHTANVAMGVLGALLLLSGYSRVVVRIRWAVPAAVAPVALMSSVSLYLGYHWVSDLVAGAVVGAVAVSAVALVSRPRRRAPRERADGPAEDAVRREGS
ncbi:phosphatase PAP2 family protein [uncultured Pseudokineococcus sp.]|uniref:phosphatase PAP2 family protein n=1 Tax=uncultured Pseudokineococcus sp. TaxID=1642928 RepID=UPI00262677C5|nr:phosphatase PAP2 family protein [uncultured Pseudokineococcus sp.]